MDGLRRLWNAIVAYARHDDPRSAAANMVALVVAWNQPFYPLYIWWSVSPTIWPSFLTFLSTPFFAAVPWLSRRNALAGRLLLCAAGIGNSVLSAKTMGAAGGVEVFLIPCALLGALLFGGRGERLYGWVVMGIAGAAYLFLHDRYGAPAHLYTDAEYAAFVRLNALSAGTLTAFIGLMFARPPERSRG